MASHHKLKCVECGKNGSFSDAKDVTQSKWRILAWDVKSGDPKVICPDCEYLPMGEQTKKKK
jgi:hypothetical protein